MTPEPTAVRPPRRSGFVPIFKVFLVERVLLKAKDLCGARVSSGWIEPLGELVEVQLGAGRDRGLVLREWALLELGILQLSDPA